MLKLSFPTLLQNTKLFTHDRTSESFSTQQSQQLLPTGTQFTMYLSTLFQITENDGKASQFITHCTSIIPTLKMTKKAL